MQKAVTETEPLREIPSERAVSMPEKKHKHFRTDGEKKFDSQAYTFWGYYMNVALSLVAVWWVERTKSGQGLINALTKGFAKVGAKEESARFLARKSFFLTGGFAVIPPIKAMEDKKAELVKKYNREIYGAKADEDPTIRQSEKEVEEAPKQSWKSVIVGRLLALVPFYITVGLLWDHTSLLGRMTNPNFKGKTTAELKAWKASNPQEFAEAASKSICFDRYISSFSRWMGKHIANLLGHKNAAEAIATLDKTAPAAIQSERDLVGKAVRDPMHSTGPYYFISEAITSAMVAIGLYLITRVTGPFFDKKDHKAPIPKIDTLPMVAASETLKRDDKTPQTRVSAAAVEHEAPHTSLAVVR